MELTRAPPAAPPDTRPQRAQTRETALALLRACRPHQWAKNVLVFVPLILAHRIGEIPLLLEFIGAFMAFGLAASSVYVLNDLADIEADRRHPVKRLRPFASGALSLPTGMIFALGLLAASLLFSLACLPLKFTGVLGVYLAATMFYSLHAKHILFVDVICLAVFYTLRIVAGSAIDVMLLSEWMLAFSIFFFLSLALLKRYTELNQTTGEDCIRLRGRDYRACDVEIVRGLGLNCGVISVLVFALYITSGSVTRLYHRPQIVWLICPILLYWVGRVWFLAARNEMPQDPVVFALRDRNSYAAGALVAMLLAAAS